jgi:1-acyl-sn-glycerol-3-phosphate acyltransferase
MEPTGLRERLSKPASKSADPMPPETKLTASTMYGKKEPGSLASAVRITLFTAWFLCCCTSILATQLLGSWLYFVNKDYYYAYMALTKQSFGILCVVGTQWFSPTRVRVSGDSSVTGQLKLTKDGRLETDFPERLVLIANHQLYPEWAYLWWIAYTSRMHGHMFIILKESLKYIPILGQGMMFYGFIFMARNWGKDQSRMEHRLKMLNSHHRGPMSGSQSLDPMWLLLFPEGTNLSPNTRKGSAKWAEKTGVEDLQHQLLPRITGLHFSLNKLKNTVDWVYDCTLGYEDIP